MTLTAAPVIADDHSTMRVVVVETDDVDGYVAALKKGKKLIEAVNSEFTISAWHATFAGPNSGSVVVAVSYPGGISAFGEAWEGNMANDEIREWVSGLDGIRTIVSDSLYSELPLD